MNNLTTRKGLLRLAGFASLSAALVPLQALAASEDTLASQAARAVLASMNDGQILPDKIIGPNGNVTNGGFYSRWMELGPVMGLALYGWPIGDLIDENIGGKSYKVQYFERVRMEYHPEFAPPYHIQLGQFGAEILALKKGGGGASGTGPAKMGPFGSIPTRSFVPIADPDAMPRLTVTDAPLHQQFHYIYNKGRYDDSNGDDGQGSWSHDLTLEEAIGGEHIHFNNVDGQWRFRLNDTIGQSTVAVTTRSRWKTQYTGGRTDVRLTLNVRTMFGAMIQIVNPFTGQEYARKDVSPLGGDVEILLPDDGRIAVRATVSDPFKTFEIIYGLGIKDRFAGINTVEAAGYTY